MHIQKFTATILITTLPFITSAQTSEPRTNTIDYPIIRSIGAVCGAGLSMDAKGELDAKLSRIFGGSVTGTGETRIDIGQAKELLEQVSENEAKQSIYRDYVTCVIQTINSISNMSKETNAPPVIDNLLIPDPLIVIKNGQRFAMKPGETRAIGRSSLIFSISKVDTGTPNSVMYIFTDAEKNSYENGRWAHQGNAINFYTGCTIVPYLIDTTKNAEKVSFYTQCK